jgi:uncharacterized protein
MRHARDFHASVFGWKYQMWGEDYCDTKDSGVASGITGDSSHSTRAPLPVIYTDDLAGAEARVREAGGVVTREVFSFPGGSRFHFRDPSGNELAIWSDR